jgi:hypothetical protein
MDQRDTANGLFGNHPVQVKQLSKCGVQAAQAENSVAAAPEYLVIREHM